MNHQARFDRVVAFVEGNLEAELDIQALAHVACMSKYHFLRQAMGQPRQNIDRL